MVNHLKLGGFLRTRKSFIFIYIIATVLLVGCGNTGETKNTSNTVTEINEQNNEAFGEKMMTMLRGLDFSLFELTPDMGRYVVGFGLAFNTNLDGSIFEHVVVDKNNKAGTK